MTIYAMYRWVLQEAEDIYQKGEAANITQMIFEHFAGTSRADMMKEPHAELTERIESLIRNAVVALKDHEPVQYITGSCWFFHMKLKVSPAVLIPRPETEELVERILQQLRNKPATSVLDIGTGSGCIAIAIKKNIPSAELTAIDTSHSALEVAKENAQAQDTAIAFMEMDFLNPSSWDQLQTFDVICSNPPYIPLLEMEKMDKHVTGFEPHQALFVPTEKPLLFYEMIEKFAHLHLKHQGMVFLETHEDNASAVAKLFAAEKYEVKVHQDLFGKDRMVTATRYR